MMASGAYLARFATHLAGRGAEVFVLDFRGHGLSKPPAAGPGSRDDWCFDDYVERDLPAAIAHVTRVTGITPGELVYVGHSLGGLAGSAAFATGAAPAPRRLILVAVNVWTHVASQPLRWIAMRAFTGVAQALGRVPARTLGIGTEDEPHSYVAQFERWTRGAWTARDGRDYASFLPSLTISVTALCGTGDWMCRPADARAFVARFGGPVTLRLVGRRHGDPIDPDHFQLLTHPGTVLTTSHVYLNPQ
jgi:predicted alpha/beta hydrolase